MYTVRCPTDCGSLDVVAKKSRDLEALENAISEWQISELGQGEKSARISPPGLQISYSS